MHEFTRVKESSILKFSFANDYVVIARRFYLELFFACRGSLNGTQLVDTRS